jgi:hypothetical protein
VHMLNFAMKLSEKGFVLRSEREFGRCLGPKQAQQCSFDAL